MCYFTASVHTSSKVLKTDGLNKQRRLYKHGLVNMYMS